jgi:SNF2 family DNA or RNA helicase
MTTTVWPDRRKRTPEVEPLKDTTLPLTVGAEVAHTPHEVVYVLTRYLAGVCDGAMTPDGHGFNRVHAEFGHKLAEMEFAEWTPRQLWAARKMLTTYSKRQLAPWWPAVPDIAEPAKPSADAAKDRRWQETHPEYTPRPTYRRLVLSQVNGVDVIELQQSYDERLIQAIKMLPQRKYDPNRKIWYLPIHIESIEKTLDFALQWGYDIPDQITNRIDAMMANMTELLKLSHADTAQITVDGLQGEMFPFQKAGVEYASRVGNVMIADEMGLGKTVQAIATLQHDGHFPAIVICPASLKRNWEREVKKWLPSRKTMVLNGSVWPIRHFDGTPVVDIFIINYNVQILRKWVNQLREIQPKAIVLDECHNVKNSKAQQSQMVRDLLRETEARKIFLSGTPVVNRPMEFWNLLSMLGYGKRLGGFMDFKQRYAYADAKRLQELNQRVRPMFFIRRRKKDVLLELPDKLSTVVPLTITNRAAYEEAEADIAGYFATKKIESEQFLADAESEARVAVFKGEASSVEEYVAQAKKREYTQSRAMAERAEQLLRWEGLKQKALEGKLPAVYQWIEEFLDDSDQKLVVFGLHTEAIVGLQQRYKDKYGAVTIHGGVDSDDRMPIVDTFQNDPGCRLIVGTMMAMGEGLTLTAASNVAFIEYGWNPKTHAQAEDRCHRIGQKDTVNVWNLVAENTIDEEIVALIESKREVVDAIQDGTGADTQATLMRELSERMAARRR